MIACYRKKAKKKFFFLVSVCVWCLFHINSPLFTHTLHHPAILVCIACILNFSFVCCCLCRIHRTFMYVAHCHGHGNCIGCVSYLTLAGIFVCFNSAIRRNHCHRSISVSHLIEDVQFVVNTHITRCEVAKYA